MSAQKSIYQLLADDKAKWLNVTRCDDKWMVKLDIDLVKRPYLVGVGNSIEEACFECMETYHHWENGTDGHLRAVAEGLSLQ